ncbi:hypothetical protein niasHS_005995 [Heterodera schachtii]|uniref:G-protein coupled receptors family 1 profile domain-containing protein n=1 Tax=Heterodera schachtii TaxID=97005 RepID=A0ABD2JN42_HETSC
MNKNSNSSSSSSVNEFGESDQIYVYTVWVTIIQQILSLFGIALNSAIVYITIKHKKFHRSFGFLLAICSLCDALTELATPLATVLVFLRKRIPLLACVYAQFLPIVASINSPINLFWISIDRFVALAFPVFFRNISRASGKYVTIVNVFSLSIFCYINYLCFIFALQHPEIMVYCEPGDMVQGEVYLLALQIVIIFTLATIVIYIIMGIMLKVIRSDQNNSNNSSHSQIEITRRIFKSLAVIMAVIFWLWFVFALITIILARGLITSDPSLQFLTIRLVMQLVTFAGAINGPVLYLLLQLRIS